MTQQSPGQGLPMGHINTLQIQVTELKSEGRELGVHQPECQQALVGVSQRPQVVGLSG